MALLSRRSLLRGAASVGIVAAVASVSACAPDDSSSESVTPTTEPRPRRAAEAGSTALLWLAHEVNGSPAGAGLAADAPADLGTLRSDADVVRAVAAAEPDVRGDLAAGTTVLVAGWALARTEGAVLAAYARTCALPSC